MTDEWEQFYDDWHETQMETEKVRAENALLRAALQELWAMDYLLVEDKDVLCTWCREWNGHTQECPFRLLEG